MLNAMDKRLDEPTYVTTDVDGRSSVRSNLIRALESEIVSSKSSADFCKYEQDAAVNKATADKSSPQQEAQDEKSPDESPDEDQCEELPEIVFPEDDAKKPF